MLHSMYVKNLALIEEIEVEFGKGLNILTGETGAGKSIILESVSLALGGRYTKDILREGTPFGLVELTFFLENEELKKQLEKLDVFSEENTLVLSRRLMDGRSISKINGETVSMSLLKEVSSLLIDVFGQHEHQSLLQKKNHQQLVDLYAGEKLLAVKKEVREAYKSYMSLEKEKKEEESKTRNIAKELDFLRFETNEITEAKLKENEDKELEEIYTRMNHGRTIKESVQRAYSFTGGYEGGADGAIARGIKALAEGLRYDEKLEEYHKQLLEIDSLLSDFNRDISEYEASLDFEDAQVQEIEARLNLVNRLKGKYGESVEAIHRYLKEKEEEIEKLENYEAYLIELDQKIEKAYAHLRDKASKLSKLRKESGKGLGEKIAEEIKDLNFEATKFFIDIKEKESITEEGMDDVEFMIALNEGNSLKPLVNVASGGELSRIMLAIKTVMAKKEKVETLIFDEIDVGISGRTAQKVSEKMAIISQENQVIAITHLPQIAAMSDVHFLIEKKTSEGDTTTRIRKIDENEKIAEIGRILGGVKITDTVKENAKEMMNLAKETKEEMRV